MILLCFNSIHINAYKELQNEIYSNHVEIMIFNKKNLQAELSVFILFCWCGLIKKSVIRMCKLLPYNYYDSNSPHKKNKNICTLKVLQSSLF